MARLTRFTLTLLVALAPVTAAADTLAAKDAAAHVGETATVCGKVVSADYASRVKGQPTFMNLDAAYPHQVFTIVIWGDDRQKFGTPDTTLMGKQICATGTIRLFHNVPEMVVGDPAKLTQQ